MDADVIETMREYDVSNLLDIALDVARMLAKSAQYRCRGTIALCWQAIPHVELCCAVLHFM